MRRSARSASPRDERRESFHGKSMGTKSVVITGVTRGLGRAMAMEFVRLGYSVSGCGRTEKEMNSLRSELGPAHDLQAVNVASDDAVRAWAARLLAARGPADLLLNNAGVINKNAPLSKVGAQEFSLVI